MADTTYTDGITLLTADTMNDLNRLHYTILGDPADVAAVNTALGFGTSSSPQFAGVNIGHATDTTLTRVSPGVAAIEGNSILTTATGALKGANSDITSLSGLTTPLSVAQGGTGAATLTANNVLLGNGTSAPQVVAPGTSGNVLTSNGTTWASSNVSTSGSFTPSVVGTSTAGTASYTQQVGTYVKIGKFVICNFGIVYTGHTGTGSMRITNLPFSSSNSGSAPALSLGFIAAGLSYGGYAMIGGQMYSTLTTNMDIFYVIVSTNVWTPLSMSANVSLYGQMCYTTND